MQRLLSRTSITIDEAVSILLGRSTGPIEFEPIDDTEEAEANSPTFCLRDTLQDELEVLQGEYDLALHERQPAHVIAEKLAAVQHQEATIEQANVYLCAIEDELGKGERSVLNVDGALSNPAYKYITLHSFNEWANSVGRERLTGAQLGVPGPASPADVEDATKPKARTKLREQEDAILVEIQKQGFDPTSLPKNPPGKRGVKAAVREALKESPLFEGKTTFKTAWERLRKDRRIVDSDPPPHKNLMGETS